MLKKGCIFIVIFLVISLSACSVPAVSTEPSETALTEPAATPPTESEASKSPAPNDVPQWPTYKIEADKAELNIRIPEGCRLEIKDARDGLLLFALQEKQIDTDGLFAFFSTQCVGIYDTQSGAVAEQWEPQEPGWCFAGAFSGTNGAVFARIDDYFNAFPSEYSVVSFNTDEQKTLQSLSGEVQVLQHLGDAVLFSYYDDNGHFGVRSVIEDSVADVLLRPTEQEKTMPLGGDLSVCGEQFTYAYVEDGQCVLLTADLSGELSRITLEYLTEKFDNLCLTPRGLVVSLSLNEGAEDAQRELALFGQNGERHAARSYGALYRMAFSSVLGCAVDSFYQPYLIAVSNDQIVYRTLSAELPEEMRSLIGEPVFFLRSDDNTLFFYYTEQQRLFRVSLAPAA